MHRPCGIYGLLTHLIVTSSLPYDYDLIIIGAGASGLFASGAAALFGGKTCLIEQSSSTFAIGGDCTNAACVPSKSFRSIVASGQPTARNAREYIRETVEKVRARENLQNDDGQQSPEPKSTRRNLDLFLGVQSCNFVGRRQVRVVLSDSSDKHLTAKKFLIATGADPIVPTALENAAQTVGIPLVTYRTLLNPDRNGQFWNLLEKASSSSTTQTLPIRVLVVGGGATACELTQCLLGLDCNMEIVWVAPSILPEEDVILQQAAYNLFVNRTTFHLGRLVGIHHDKRPIIQSARDNPNISSLLLLEPVDAILLCIGRRAATRELSFDVAGVKLDDQGRIRVRPNLRSISNRHVYAAGDCCMIPSRRRSSSQAGWTGFHAIRNLKLPFLPFGNSFANSIPRIIYTRPELACVGMTNVECIRRFGVGNFQRQFASEQGMDRADMDRCFHSPLGFVELRADRYGRILGCTAYGLAAAEITNSMAIAIENNLTVQDIARAPFGYPSHGYLLYRVALSMALSTNFGLLDAFGFRTLSKAAIFLARRLSLHSTASKNKRDLEAIGHDSTVLYNGQILTYFDLHQNLTDLSASHLKQLTEAETIRFESWSKAYRRYDK